MVIEGFFGDARLFQDLIDAYGVDTVLVEKPEGGVNQLLAFIHGFSLLLLQDSYADCFILTKVDRVVYFVW